MNAHDGDAAILGSRCLIPTIVRIFTPVLT